MKIKTLLLCTLLLLLPALCLAEKNAADKTRESPAEAASKEKQDYEKLSAMLLSISELKGKLEQQLKSKEKSFKKNPSNGNKQEQEEQLKKLRENLTQTTNDFEKIATGIDVSKFQTPEKTVFNWKTELFSLIQPGIVELKRLTVQARRKSELLNQQENYQELLPIAQKAHDNLQKVLKNSKDPVLRKEIKLLIPQWENTVNQLQNGLDIANMELASIAAKKRSPMESGKEAAKSFFRTSGLYIAISILTCAAIIAVLRLIHLIIRRTIPGGRKEYRPVHLRIIDLFFQVLTVVCSLFSFVFVFYFFEDWLLLSFAILFLMGISWTTKTLLPKFWRQSCMMLNFGDVREGERVVLYGVPWLVKNINFRTKLENPTLGMTIRVPIDDLLDKTSRTFNKKEPWFPCRKDDWVILSDGTRGCAISISYEQVELLLRGGAYKTYQTKDFLSLAPMNLSRNFRIKEIFGIGYTEQAEATTSVLEKMQNFLLMQIEKEGYHKEMLNLRVEFNSAGESSLDLVVIADFKGSQAPIYNRLRRAIQRWCLDACNQYGWDVPFPQLTLHKGREWEESK